MKYSVKVVYDVIVDEQNEADAETAALVLITSEKSSPIVIKIKKIDGVPYPPEELTSPLEKLNFYDEYYQENKNDLDLKELEEISNRVQTIGREYPGAKNYANAIFHSMLGIIVDQAAQEAVFEKMKCESNRKRGKKNENK